MDFYVGIIFTFDALQTSRSLVISGPLWTGPLHDTAYVTEMLDLARQYGWVEGQDGKELDKLLKLMIDESNPKLPFGYIKLDEVSTEIPLLLLGSSIIIGFWYLMFP